MKPAPLPILVQSLAPAVASVRENISPLVVFKNTVPTPPLGFVDTVGSELDLVISLGRLVSDAPDIAGKEPDNLLADIAAIWESATVPVNLVAATPAIFASVISPSNRDSVVIFDIAIMLYPFFIIFGWIYC